MTKYVSYLKDVLNNDYVGVKFTKEESEIKTSILKWMVEFDSIKKVDISEFVKNKNVRDGDSYHITLFNVMEWNDILKNFSKEYIKNNIFDNTITDIVFKGIGRANKNGNEVNFIIIESEKLDSIRDKFNLEKKDLHITLGFDKKDVFGVSKGIDTRYIKL